MIFCTPKDKVTHCVKDILNDGDGDENGDKNSGDGDTFCGDGTQRVGTGRGWGLTQWGRDGDRDNGDGWGWGQILVPVQLSTPDSDTRVPRSAEICGPFGSYKHGVQYSSCDVNTS